MDAPVYVSGTAFEMPSPVPVAKLSVENVSLKEMMSAPDAWAIVVKHAPALNMTVKAAQVQPYLTNMTVDSFVKFGVLTQSAVDSINAELAQLPKAKWPAL